MSQYGCTGVDDLFGTKDKKSKIIFSESILNGSQPKTVTRNAIDRFSGGTVDAALFTEEARYGGEAELRISMPPVSKLNQSTYDGIFKAMADLSEGILALGGETSIGHGLFKVEKIEVDGITVCGNDLTGEQVYKALYKRIIGEEQ